MPPPRAGPRAGPAAKHAPRSPPLPCGQVLLNEQAGHLLRAKLADVDEGGVCAGFAVLSSPVLYP